jgi:hypothetical protein
VLFLERALLRAAAAVLLSRLLQLPQTEPALAAEPAREVMSSGATCHKAIHTSCKPETAAAVVVLYIAAGDRLGKCSACIAIKHLALTYLPIFLERCHRFLQMKSLGF